MHRFRQKGYSLIEIMIALIIGSFLIVGVSTVYSSIDSVSKTSKNLEQAQEVLRYSSQIFHRSLKQTTTNPIIANVNQLTITQSTGAIACNGQVPNIAPAITYTEVYTLNGINLECDVNGVGPEVLLTGVDKISYVLNDNLVEITITPKGLPANFGGSIQIDVSLSGIILVNALGI